MKILKYTFYAIGGYLVLANYTGFGKDVTSATTGGTKFVKTLQGR